MPDPIDHEVSAIKSALEARRGCWPAIATKADVSHSWISKFVNGHIPNPGVETLKAVRDALETIQQT